MFSDNIVLFIHLGSIMYKDASEIVNFAVLNYVKGIESVHALVNKLF